MPPIFFPGTNETFAKAYYQGHAFYLYFLRAGQMKGHSFFRGQFGNQTFLLDCNNATAYDLASFLFADLKTEAGDDTPIRLDIIAAGPLPIWSLWRDEQRLYFGTSLYQLAYILMNEVIYQSIDRNREHHALHAAAVEKDGRCLLFPGKSGNGKSTLTAWLTANGYHYLTDELVLLSDSGKVLPFTRPINLKVDATHPSWLVEKEKIPACLITEGGSMIPHRLLNKDFQALQPKLTDIIFPQYTETGPLLLQEISAAQSCMHLLQSHVNARNMQGLGISAISKIVRGCRSFTLCYSKFADLASMFLPALHPPS